MDATLGRQALAEQLAGVPPRGQRHPKEQAAVGPGPAHSRGKVPGEGGQHSVPALAIDQADVADVPVQESSPGGLEGARWAAAATSSRGNASGAGSPPRKR
jgi:hypothetical protein